VVAFQVANGASSSVYVARAGAAPSCVDADGVAGCDGARNPHLSADGRLLTYEANDPAAGGTGVFVLDRVTGLAEAVGGATPSSDGQGEAPAVAFTSTGSTGPDVVVRDRVTLLASSPTRRRARAARRSPDGRTVAYAKSGGSRTTPDLLDARADADGDGSAEGPCSRRSTRGGALAVLSPPSRSRSAARRSPSSIGGRVFARGAARSARSPSAGAVLARAVAASDEAVCVLLRPRSARLRAGGSSALVDFGVQGDGSRSGDVVAVLSRPAARARSGCSHRDRS
jgi:hypothetical protein